MRAQLRSLARGVAEQVMLRLVATGELIDVDPDTALAHATVARRLASRIPAVREAVGLAAYHAGQWQTAIRELRAYHRMSGRQSHLAVLADCERALGRPERAIDIFRTADRSQLSDAEAAELLIVAAGARADLGQREAAAAMLQVPQLSIEQPWVARLRYAYADALLALGRTAEARDWFARAAELDLEATTDAAERLLELDGVVLDEAEEPEAPEPGDEEAEAPEPGHEGADAQESRVQGSGAEASGREESGPGAGEGGVSVGGAGDRGYSVDGAHPDGTAGGDGPAEAMSDVEDAVAYEDDDLEDLDDDDLDDEDFDDEDFDEDDDFDDDDFDEDDDLDPDDEDDDFGDDEFDDDEFDDDDLEGDDDDDFEDDEFDDDLEDEDSGDEARGRR